MSDSVAQADVGGPETVPDGSAASPWTDLDAYLELPRLGGLTLSPDGRELVVAISRLERERTGYASALWSVDPAGQQPARRLTRSLEGETAAAFLPDGSLLFTSRRPVPKATADVTDTTKALWCLPAHGEAFVLAQRDGGWGAVHTARRSSHALFEVSMHRGVADEPADAALRKARRKTK